MDTVRKSLQDLEIGSFVAHGNLAMWPLLGGDGGTADYLLLGAAIEKGVARVEEVSANGHVPELKLVNGAEVPVLILEGEELRGVKQHRTTNLTILAPARSTIVIPVSCVEAGRWHASSAVAQVSNTVHMARGRAAKAASVSHSLHHGGHARADQGRVWSDIDEAVEELRAPAPTRGMNDIFKARQSEIEDYVSAFEPTDGQVGALFAIAGEPVGFDVFNHHSTLSEMLPKLVRSYTVDAIRSSNGNGRELVGDAARSLVDAAVSASVETFPAVGLGTTVRILSDGLVGGGLVLDDRLVHLAVFAVEQDRAARGRNGRGMASFSTRSRSYRR